MAVNGDKIKITLKQKRGFPACSERAKRAASRKAKYHILAFSLTCLGIENNTTFATFFGKNINTKFFKKFSNICLYLSSLLCYN